MIEKCIKSLIRAYQHTISPFIPMSCRFIPTCSEYSIKSIEKYGVVKGTLLTLKRILKCHPLHRGGYDPVR